jgi:hypothetical protein
MKKLFFLLSLCAVCVSSVLAEPLLLEQATNVLPQKGLELGLSDILYQYDTTDIENAGGTTVLTITQSSVLVPLYLRYAFSNKIEGILDLPYLSQTLKSETTGSSTSTTESGLSDPVLGVKINLKDEEGSIKLGVAALVKAPFGDAKFRQGFNIQPLLLASKELGSSVLNANLSYNMTGEYEDDDTAKTKINPGDVLQLGLGLEHPLYASCSCLTGIAEFIYQSLGESTVASVAQSGSSGARMDLALGVRFNKGSLKAKLGFALSLGEEKYRQYDYKIIAGISYLLNI